MYNEMRDAVEELEVERIDNQKSKRNETVLIEQTAEKDRLICTLQSDVKRITEKLDIAERTLDADKGKDVAIE
jgi:hypothetical protein